MGYPKSFKSPITGIIAHLQSKSYISSTNTMYHVTMTNKTGKKETEKINKHKAVSG
jgi:hypothetical protein